MPTMTAAKKTIFEQIIDGEIPSYKVWEDENHYAFLDISPIAPGHTLVIPKKPAQYLFDLEDSEYTNLMRASKLVAKMLKKAFPHVPRIGVIVAGFGVPDHIHIHLIPISSEGELLGTSRATSKEELTSIHTLILSSQ